jgi:glycerate kinase
MRIVIAPDKFKGSLDAPAVARAIREGILCASSSIDVQMCPVADGGEGTVAALVAATGGRIEIRRVTGPRVDLSVSSPIGILGNGKTAVIEMASASGLLLLPPDRRDPTRTTTFGTGQLIAAAAELGVTEIIVGLGGSATIDGGIGCCQACELPVLLEDGEPLAITEPLVGGDLDRVVLIKRGRGGIAARLDRIRIRAACDVNVPLCGQHGAAALFGPQKGASPAQVAWFDDALARLAKRCDHEGESMLPGAGAAGGLGFALASFFGAALEPGIDVVTDAIGLTSRLAGADFCITGEGRLDEQTAHGKAVAGVVKLCKAAGVPCIALAGSLAPGWEQMLDQGLTAAFCICDGPMDLAAANSGAERLIRAAAENVTRLWMAGRLDSAQSSRW